MTKMTEVERQQRGERFINNMGQMHVQSLRDWQSVMDVFDIPTGYQIALLESIKHQIDDVIRRLTMRKTA